MKFKYKTTKASQIYFLTVLLLVIHNYLLYIFPVKFDRYNFEIAIIAIMILIVGGITLSGDKKINTIVIMFLIIIMYTSIYSSILYKQSLINSLFADKYLFVTLLYFPIMHFISKRDVNSLVNLIIFLTFILTLLLDIQCLILHKKGIELLKISYASRMSDIRVLASANFIEVGTIISFSRLFDKKIKNKKLKILSLITFILGNIEIIFISKTRMSILIVWASVFLILITKEIKLTVKTIFKRVFFLMLIYIIISQAVSTNIFSEYVKEFDTMSISVENRQGAVEYYLSNLEKSPFNIIFGTGFIHDTNYQYKHIITGMGKHYSRTDVGLLGFVHQFGIIGLLWYGLTVLYLIKILIKMRKKNEYPYELVAIFSYFVFGSITLFMMNAERIIFFPIMMAIANYYSSSLKSNYERNIINEETKINKS